MGYRGEDRSSERAAWGAQSPRQSSRQHTDYDSQGYNGTEYDGPGYDSAGYGGTAGYDGAGHDGAGYDGAGHDGYGSGSYRADDRDSGGYADSGGYRANGYRGDDYDSGAHQAGGYGGTGAYSSGGYDSGGYTDDYGSGSHPTQNYHGAPYDTSYGSGSHHSGGYPALGQGSGGYPALGQGSGGYPALGQGSGGYPTLDPDSYDDGNDWYARSGPIPAGGFADTSAQLAIRDTPSRDLVPRDAVTRDPVRGYPPEPARPDPGLAATRQQVMYDESAYVSYPGYDGMEDEAPGYDSRRGYDHDDYADATRLDQVAIGFDSPGDPRGGRGYGQPPQRDGFDGGYHDDPGQPDEVRTGPGKKPKKSKKSKQPKADQPKRRSRRALVLSAVAVVLVAAAGYGGYRVLLKSKAANTAVDQQVSQPLPSASIATATQKCVQQLGQYCHIELRTDDPAPLTISEIYPPAVFSTTSKLGFLLAGTRTDKNCSSAVYGAGLAAQLKKGGCTQALRASYVSNDKTIMGTIGVFNLRSTNEAHYAAKLINESNFVLPLSSAHGIIAKLGQGTGVVEPEFKGHYLILTYAELASLKTPTQAQQQQLQTWENALVASTANVYLSQLMVNGDSAAASASASASASTSAKASPSATR